MVCWGSMLRSNKGGIMSSKIKIISTKIDSGYKFIAEELWK